VNGVVVDTSALTAILEGEALATRLMTAMVSAEAVLVPAPVVVESKLVASGWAGAVGPRLVDALLRQVAAKVIPFGGLEAEFAAEGFVRYGKGRHPAGLNFGDCLVYGVARVTKLPLLFVGDDFGQTDLVPAAY
jgi:ribonuclease VapC